ncbi:MAG: DUF11 domain-containing protein, partial [Candidatus Riflebacteria bacterium]|nr:DUF11 domain-containing protein [Candidatus Riflebacteria bacterium]
MLRRSWQRGCAFLAVWALAAVAVSAQTPAGTVILNQAVITFAVNGLPFRVESNVVPSVVLPLRGLSVTPNGTVEAPAQSVRCRAGLPAVVPYILVNTGNVTDSYDVAVLRVNAHQDAKPASPRGAQSFEPQTLQLFLDANANGVIDGDDREVSRLTDLPAGESRSLLVQVLPPAVVPAEAVAYLKVTGASVADTNLRDTDNVSQLRIVEDAVLTATKSAEPSSVVAGRTVHYVISGSNNGSAAAKMASLEVDGATLRGVVIKDPIPSHVQGVRLELDSVRWMAPVDAITLYSLDRQASWTAYRPTTNADVTDVGMLIPDGLAPGQVYRLQFDVTTPETMPGGSLVNLATLNFETTVGVEVEVQTNPTRTTVIPHPALVFGPEGRPDEGLGGDPTRNDEDYQEIRAPLTGQTIVFRNTLLNSGDTQLDLLLSYVNPPQPGNPNPRALPFGSVIQFFAADGVTPLMPGGSGSQLAAGSVRPGGTLDVVVHVTLPHEFTVAQGAYFDVMLEMQSARGGAVRNLTTDRLMDIRNTPEVRSLIELAVTPDEPVAPGATLFYLITFENTATTTQTNVVISDTLPRELENFRDFEAGIVDDLTQPGRQVTVRPSYDPDGVLTWVFTSLPPGFRGQLRFTADVKANVVENTRIDNEVSMASLEAPAAIVAKAVSAAVVRPNLRLEKEASRPAAAIGEVVAYRLSVVNQNPSLPLHDVTVEDFLPAGLRLRPGSVTVDGTAAPDPAARDGGRRLTFRLGTLPDAARPDVATRVVIYQAIVGADARQGDAVNTAISRALTPPPTQVALESAPKSARVRIRNQGFSLRGVIVGRVYHDNDRNGAWDAADKGVQGVRIYLDDGTFVITDREGKYHFEGVLEGQRAVKLDRRTLPAGTKLLPQPRRTRRGEGDLYWDRMGPVELMKVNFRLEPERTSRPAAMPATAPATVLTVPPPPPPTRPGDFDSSWFPPGEVTVIIGSAKPADGAVVLSPPVPLALTDAFVLLGPRGAVAPGQALQVDGTDCGPGKEMLSGLVFGLGNRIATTPASTLRLALQQEKGAVRDASPQTAPKGEPNLLPVLFGKNRTGRPVVLVTPESLPAAMKLLEESGCQMQNGIWVKRALGAEVPGPRGSVPAPAIGAASGPQPRPVPVSEPSALVQVSGVGELVSAVRAQGEPLLRGSSAGHDPVSPEPPAPSPEPQAPNPPPPAPTPPP